MFLGTGNILARLPLASPPVVLCKWRSTINLDSMNFIYSTFQVRFMTITAGCRRILQRWLPPESSLKIGEVVRPGSVCGLLADGVG